MKFNKHSKTQKIVWAFDAFSEDRKLQTKASKAIKPIFPEADIQPVSIMNRGKLDIESRSFAETWKEVEKLANNRASKLLSGANGKPLLPYKLIKNDGMSIRGNVNGVIKFALEEGASLIVTSSHARKGVNRFFLGSFAETLVLRSPLPTLIVNPTCEVKGKVSNIVFPTDFSSESRQAFEQVVELASQINAKVLVLHKLYYLYPELGYPFVVPPVSKESLLELLAEERKKGARWVRAAELKGVKAKFHLLTKQDAVTGIVKAAKKLGSSTVIAMASQSGPVAASLLGSLTRQVIRNAPCPVLVLHAEKEALIKNYLKNLKEEIELKVVQNTMKLGEISVVR